MSEPYVCKLVYDSPEPQKDRFLLLIEKHKTMHCFSNSTESKSGKYMCMCVDIYIYIYIHIYVCVYMYIHTYTYIYILHN